MAWVPAGTVAVKSIATLLKACAGAVTALS